MATAQPSNSMISIHFDNHETEEHVHYQVKAPSDLSKILCVLIAKGLVLDHSWGRDDLEDWSVWFEGVCIESHGEHKKFAGLQESKVEWLYGD